jgi:plastocyanin
MRVQKLLDDRRLLLPVLVTAVAIAIGSVLIIALAADSSGGGSSASTGMAPAKGVPGSAGGPVKIDIRDFKYVPETVTVRAGSPVTWINDDMAPHTATATGVFDTGTVQRGDSKALTLSKPGSYSYVCEFHPFMKATVVVK